MAVYGLVSCFSPKELVGSALADLVAHFCICVLLGTSGGTLLVCEDPEMPEAPSTLAQVLPVRFPVIVCVCTSSARMFSRGTSQRLSSNPNIHPHSAEELMLCELRCGRDLSRRETQSRLNQLQREGHAVGAEETVVSSLPEAFLPKGCYLWALMASQPHSFVP